MIYYLAHPYQNNPIESFNNAVEWTSRLRLQGYVVFNPILHTHPFHMKVCDETVYSEEFVRNKMDYVSWDLALMDAMMAHDGEAYSWYCEDHGHKGPHYPRDSHPKCLSFTPKTEDHCCNKPYQLIAPKYDSGITVLLSNTAFKSSSFGGLLAFYQSWKEYLIADIDWNSRWISQGCRQEYEYAKTNNVRVLELEAFLDRREVEL